MDGMKIEGFHEESVWSDSYRLEKARLKFITLMLVQLDLELIRIDDYVES